MTDGYILLVNPWIHDFAAHDLWAEPLGLLSIGAVLRENGYRVQLLDCLDRWHPALLARQRRTAPPGSPYGTGKWPKTILPTPHVLAHVRRYYGRYGRPLDLVQAELAHWPRPDAVLVTSGMTYWYPGVAEAIQVVRARWPGVSLALGGVYATLCPDHAATLGADVVLPGEGELNALHWVDAVTGRTSDWARYRALDDYPGPAHDLRASTRSIGVLTARGCPYGCPYCATHRLNPGFRQRDPRRVVAEIAYWAGRGTTDMAFFDDALLVNADRHLRVILDEVVGRGLRVRFHTPNGLHANLLDEALARQMRQAGFETIRLSLETADEAQQQATGGKVSRAGFERAVAALWAAGFTVGQVGAYVLVGRPGQLAAEAQESVAYAHALGVPVRLAFYSPIPGTPDYAQAVAAGALPPDPDPLWHNHTVWPLAGRWMTAAEIQAIKDQALAGNQRLQGAGA
ncbi:MAG: radical SAM protein [Chloroflexi bacterium]|nr:radical SAM protein [Chloroflexota bacterium]MBU1750112.1 radical SAM protein [Chloroflexota bacterium]